MTTTTTTAATATPATTAARTAGWTGVAFAVAFIAGFVLVAAVPAYDDPDAAWIDYVEDSGDRLRTVIGSLLLCAAGLLLMAFTTSLARHVNRETRSPLDGILHGAGVIAGTTLLLAAIIGGSMSAGVTFASDFPTPSAEMLRVLDQVSIAILLLGTGWSVAVVVACASRSAARSATLPGWLTTTGLVVSAALLVSFLFLPILLVPLWALVTGIALLRGRGAPELMTSQTQNAC